MQSTGYSVTLTWYLIKNEIFIELLIIYQPFDTSSKKPLKEQQVAYNFRFRVLYFNIRKGKPLIFITFEKKS